MCTHICAERMCVKATGQLQIIILKNNILLLWSMVSHWPTAHQLGKTGWPVCPRDLSLPSQCWDYMYMIPCLLALLCGFWDSNESGMSFTSLSKSHFLPHSKISAQQTWELIKYETGKQHLVTIAQRIPWHLCWEVFETLKVQMNSLNPWETAIKFRVYIWSLWVFKFKSLFLEVGDQLPSYPLSAPHLSPL